MSLSSLFSRLNPFSRTPNEDMASPTEPPDSQVEGYSYPITPLYVHQARQILLQLHLPVELILEIFETANYRPVLCAHQDKELSMSSHSGVSNEAGDLYLTSPAVPVGDKQYNATHRLKYVKFKTHSSDQGWSDDVRSRGTYNGSWTWFEATILRPFKNTADGQTSNQGKLESTLSRKKWRNALDARDSLQSQGWDLVMESDDKPMTWHVQSNLTAAHEPREHEVLWERGKLTLTKDEITGESNGMGSGENFFETFQEGDRIALWARAMFPGWSNNVKSASIEIGFDEHEGE